MRRLCPGNVAKRQTIRLVTGGRHRCPLLLSRCSPPAAGPEWTHRVIGPAGHVSDHHVGHRHDLAVLGLLDEDGDAARDGLAVELDALSASDELPVAVVTCDHRNAQQSPAEAGEKRLAGEDDVGNPTGLIDNKTLSFNFN